MLFQKTFVCWKQGVSKLNRLIPSSAVGARFACPKTQSKLFSGEQPHPYELNDSIIHILTHSPVFYKAYCLFSSVREVDIQSPFTHNGCWNLLFMGFWGESSFPCYYFILTVRLCNSVKKRYYCICKKGWIKLSCACTTGLKRKQDICSVLRINKLFINNAIHTQFPKKTKNSLPSSYMSRHARWHTGNFSCTSACVGVWALPASDWKNTHVIRAYANQWGCQNVDNAII